MSNTELSRAKIRRILKSRRGAMAELARTLEVNPSTITIILRGRSDSARVLAAARALAETISAETQLADNSNGGV